MEINQLHYFKTVAKYESFTKAAEELHITQSALSRSIAALEDDIGIKLFERKKGGKINLNRDGRFFLAHVIQVLNTLENTVSAVKEMGGLQRGVVNIALSECVFIKNVVYDFLTDYPSVRLNCRLQSNEQMKKSLEDGTLNFALCKEPIPSPDLEWHPLFKDRMTVMFPPGHPLSKRKDLHLDELSHEHFIISNVGYDMSSDIVRMCNLAGFDPYIVYEGTGEDLCGKLVSAGIGIMMAPRSINQGVRLLEIEQIDIRPVPLVDNFAYSEVGVVIKTGQFQSEAAMALYERIVDFYAELTAMESN